ncbi:Beta-barrel assembly machine subunit BamE [Cereibacter ovatus]|uniref:Beta-barrel assembly machine subunit BamE n=1 Tax=Cereibacter ovatus TaxID=439529 RepID=A0A285CJ08_9RHOB|nr:outer membrane protein assembly factor BamE [Cereibacter ovatus]SNX67582.1 Beta-barrel assembly machine subunit BamE [Cereibacter ovatus]
MVREGGMGAADRGRWLRRAALVVALSAGVAACQPIYRNHGYVPTDQDLAQVQVGRDTRETVATAVGRPTAAGLLNDEGWYYVQSRVRHYGAKEPQEVERQVVAISFDQNGVVRNVERFGLEQGRIVPLSRRVTESNIRGTSFLRQLFGNIGLFRAEDVIE